MKILLIGHACGPNRGSEPGSTWNLARELAHSNDVWVLTHPQHRQEIEEDCVRNPNPRLHFAWLELTRFDPWKPATGQHGIRLHYLMWLPKAAKLARELHNKIHFDIVHHVSLSSISAPSSFWQLDAPFVWGPVGGGQCAPSAFRSYFRGTWMKESLRSLRVKLLPYSKHLRRTVAAAQMVLASNAETLKVLQLAGAKRTKLFLDSGVNDADLAREVSSRNPNSRITLLWAGRLEQIKALPLLLHAMGALPGQPVTLVVAGDGPEREACEKLANELGLSEAVTFVGHLKQSALSDLMLRSDAFVFTSLRDSFGSVVLEALARSLPVVTFQHQGVGTFLPPEACIKLRVSSPKETIQDLAAAIQTISENPAALRPMRAAALQFARAQTWARRAQAMTVVYQEAVHAYRAV
ncbi:MAG: glycosyltransferase family 4 protein [Bryobacteraceae bacterium]